MKGTEIEARMSKAEARIKTLTNELIKVLGSQHAVEPAPSELDIKVVERIDEVLKNVRIDNSSTLIGNDSHNLRINTNRGELILGISEISDTRWAVTLPATRDHFDIIEGTLEQAELGDLFVVDTDPEKDVRVVGFKDDKCFTLYTLKGHLIDCNINTVKEPVSGIILRRRK